MKKYLSRWLALLCLCAVTTPAAPPVVRSTEYDGSYSNIIRYPSASWMNSNNVHLTVEAWVYCEDLDYMQTFVARHNSTNFWFGVSGDRLRFYRSGGTFTESDATLVARRWTHVAVTYNGSTAKFFINGTNAGSAALAHAGNDSTNSLCLGGQRDIVNFGDLFTSGYAFHGSLDEVRLWSEARTAAEIASGMNQELRSGPGLLAAFGTGGDYENIHNTAGTSLALNVVGRESGFGLLPRGLLIPWTYNALSADGVVDLLNEYRGAETMVLRSSDPYSSAPDQAAYLIRSWPGLSAGSHLYVGVPALPQAGLPLTPRLQVKCDVSPGGGNAPGVGDWECRLRQDGLQGGTRYDSDPPFFPTPAWLPWGQSVSNWNAATLGAFEFHQSYEFRIHEDHLNHFTNSVGLVVQYGDFLASGELLTAPGDALTNQPTTYAPADWYAQAVTGLRAASYSGVVSNVTVGGGEAGWTVSLWSGPNPLSATEIDSMVVGSNGIFVVSGSVPAEHPTYVRLDLRSGYNYLPPEFTGPGVSPSDIDGNTALTYPACVASCTPQVIHFRVLSPPGPVSVTGMSPTTGSPELVLRDTPRKVLPSTIVTLTGTNLHPALDVYLTKCTSDPAIPAFCTTDVDIFRCTVLSNDATGHSLTVQLPTAENSNFFGSMKWVLKDNNIGHPGWTQWVFGPTGFEVTQYHAYPLLHGFEFQNEDDGPSLQEFEACYGSSIFTFVPVPPFQLRDPFYALWAIVYMAWMDGADGSCYGMASTSRLLEEGTIPLATYDGGHGVHYGNGFPGNGLPPVAPKPGRWTGFDVFQPFRPINLWAQITANAGAQTSGEAIGLWLSQMRTPQTDGPRRGLNCGDPLAVLNRVRAMPHEYVICIGDRDFGRGHCVTPYGVLDEQGLMPDLRTRTNAPGFSLIQVYDNNHPGEERFVLVDRTLNIFRYEGGVTGGPYEGPGLFWTPMSLFRGSRHAPGPEVLGRYGVDYLRVLTMGAVSAAFTNTAGEQAGWSASGLNTNGYAGAQHYQPQGVLPDGASRFDTTMLFLPQSNAPVAGSLVSRGSNVLVYGGMGWGDMAFGFNAPNSAVDNSVDGILIGMNQGLQAMGFRAGAPVLDFGAMIASRTSNGSSRVFLIDAGTGELTPDLLFEREELNTVKIRNRSIDPFNFRLNIAGADPDRGGFEYAYQLFTLLPQATVTFRLVPDGARHRLTREVDLNSDGTPELVEDIPANGELRATAESSQMALRWRQLARNETLQSTKKITGSPWSPVATAVTTEGPDQVARVATPDEARFYRLCVMGTNCLDFSGFELGSGPNPWDTNGFKFEALSAVGALLPKNKIVALNDHIGLEVVHTMRVLPQDDYAVIHIDVIQTSGLVSFEAVGPLGVVVARATVTGPGDEPQRATLRGFRGRLQYVRIIAPNAQCAILNICGEREAQTVPNDPSPDCVNFETLQPAVLNSPAQFGVAEFASGQNTLTIEPVLGLNVNGLLLNTLVTMQFIGTQTGCDRVTLRLHDPSGGTLIQAYDTSGTITLDSATTVASSSPKTIVLNGPGIGHVYLYFGQGQGHLLEFCCERSAGP